MKLSKTRATVYSNLGNVKMRRRYGLFTSEGEKNVSDTAKWFPMEAILTTEKSKMPEKIRNLAAEQYEVSEREMKSLTNFSTPSDVMGIFRIPEPPEIEIDEAELYLLLDGVRDPGNMGTIIRTCHWFGIRTIFASFDSVDCFNPKTVQSAMGSLGAVTVRYCHLEELIISHRGMPLYGTLLEGKDIFATQLENKGFLAMGNEGKGLSEGIRSLVAYPLTIPPYNAEHGESLNVAVATAIAIAQFRK